MSIDNIKELKEYFDNVKKEIRDDYKLLRTEITSNFNQLFTDRNELKEKQHIHEFRIEQIEKKIEKKENNNNNIRIPIFTGIIVGIVLIVINILSTFFLK
jgi:hypothetical protein